MVPVRKALWGFQGTRLYLHCTILHPAYSKMTSFLLNSIPHNSAPTDKNPKKNATRAHILAFSTAVPINAFSNAVRASLNFCCLRCGTIQWLTDPFHLLIEKWYPSQIFWRFIMIHHHLTYSHGTTLCFPWEWLVCCFLAKKSQSTRGIVQQESEEP